MASVNLTLAVQQADKTMNILTHLTHMVANMYMPELLDFPKSTTKPWLGLHLFRIAPCKAIMVRIYFQLHILLDFALLIPYWSCGIIDGLRRPNFDGPVNGFNYAHIQDARIPQLNHQDVWQSSYQENISLQRPYSKNFGYYIVNYPVCHYSKCVITSEVFPSRKS